MKTRTKVELLAMLMIGAAACGGGDKPSTSNANPNNTENNTTNNTSGMNNTTAGTNNTPATNNTTPTTPDGAITLVSPNGEFSASGTATLVFEVGEDVESVELLIDGAPEGTIEAPFVHELDTTSLSEDRHIIGVEYVVDGETLRAEEMAVVIVDRTAPSLVESMPADGAISVSNSGPIQLSFDEAIDPASLSELAFTLGGQSATVWIENETDVLIDFDWAALELPYDASLDYSGLTDAAGNSAAGTLTWTAPEYLAESPGDLSNVTWYTTGGVEYVIGSRRAGNDFEIVALRGEATDNDHKDWIIIESINVVRVLDLDVAITDDGTAHVFAAIRDTSAAGQLATMIQLIRLEAGATEFTLPASRVYPASATASYSVSIFAGPTKLQLAVVSADDSVHDVFTLGHRGIFGGLSTDLFPVMFNNTIPETVTLGATEDERPLMVFARCVTATTPCAQSEVDAFVLENAAWAALAAPLQGTTVNNPSCERFDSLDLVVDGASTYVAVSNHSSCLNDRPDFKIYEAVGGAWEPMLANGLATEMALPADDYIGRIAKNPAGGLFVAAQSDSMLALGSLSGGTITDLGVASDGVDTSTGTFSDSKLTTDGTNPILTTSFGGSALLIRNN